MKTNSSTATRHANPVPGATKETGLSASLSTHCDRLRFLAACLNFDSSPAARQNLRSRLAQDLPWRAMLDLANQELLTPTLWARLRQKDLHEGLPAPVAGAMRRGHTINVVRNERIKAQLMEALRNLNARDVEPLLLKGVVDLFISRYGDPGARILRDVDLFAPERDIERARDALVASGYQVVPREAGKFVTYFIELTRPDAVVAIDLQWYISGQRDVLSPEEAFRASVLHHDGGVRFRTLSANHQIVHNLLHSELQDRGADLGFVWLRQLLDLAALCRQLGAAVAWDQVQEHFSRRQLPSLVAKRIYLAHRLLGMAMPPPIRPTIATRLHYGRCLGQLRWPWMSSAMRSWATITSPFDARLLDLIYDSGTGRRQIMVDRIRHAGRLIYRHHKNLREIVRRRRAKFDQA